MVSHYKCKKCGSRDVERKSTTKAEAEATIYKEGDVGFGTKQEEGISILRCKRCNNMDEDKFELMPDTD